MKHPHRASMAALLATCGTAFGQATTNPAPKPSENAPALPLLAPREHDAAGHVKGPGKAGWWNDAVFYEVFVRSFKDSSEGPLAKDGVGDLRGLIQKLDYLNDGDPATTTDLGITGLWLMPINPSPSYHGYDVTDYTGVQAQYGTLDDFRALTAACHKRGIRVILDLVLNHCSDKHPWFAAAADPKSPTHDWFIWSDTNPGWKGPWNEQVWHTLGGGRRGGAAASTGPWYYGIFSSRMPDLNYRNAAASREMLSVVDFWVSKENGADGYRLDAVRHLVEDGPVQENTPETHAWLRTFRQRLKAANPEAMSIGEVWTSSAIASSYVGDQLDMAFEFDLAAAMVEAAKSGKAKPMIDAQERVLEAYPPNQYGRFLSNHDQTRVMTALKGDDGAMRAAAAMLLLGPGVPFLYYGEEIGMTGDKPDERLRTPMQWTAGPGAGFTEGTPWQAVAGNAGTVNVATESASAESLLSWYRRLIRLRAELPALSRGGFAAVESGHPGVYAFLRTSDEPQARQALVVINLTAGDVSAYALRLQHGPAALGGAAWRTREVLHADPALKPGPGDRPVATLTPHGVYVFAMEPVKK